jgi:hypothetical protein
LADWPDWDSEQPRQSVNRAIRQSVDHCHLAIGQPVNYSDAMFDPALLRDQMSFIEARLRARGLRSVERTGRAGGRRGRASPPDSAGRETSSAIKTPPAKRWRARRRPVEDPSAVFAANKARAAEIR